LISAGTPACKGATVEQLLHRADQALYQAKNTGRNCTVEGTEQRPTETKTACCASRSRVPTRNALTRDIPRLCRGPLPLTRRCAHILIHGTRDCFTAGND
jgi:hypothetical protein